MVRRRSCQGLGVTSQSPSAREHGDKSTPRASNPREATALAGAGVPLAGRRMESRLVTWRVALPRVGAECATTVARRPAPDPHKRYIDARVGAVV